MEDFGGGRKFRPAIPGKGVPKIHIYQGGFGMQLMRSSAEVTGCLIQNGLETGIQSVGTDSDQDGLKVLYCTIRNIGRHPWGGSWAHGNGEGVSTGNLHNVLIARNVIENCSNVGIWLDNYPNRGVCKNVRIIENRFANCGSLGIFSELRISDVMIAYNVFAKCRRGGVRVGPVTPRNRVLGNLFHDIKSYGGHLSVYSRTEGRKDTIAYFALAGNVFSQCKSNFAWSKMALDNPKQYFDWNVWHVAEDGEDKQGAFEVVDSRMDFAGAWKQLRSPKFIASGENSKVVSRSPVTRDAAGVLQSDPSPISLVTPALLDDLKAKGFLNQEEHDFLKMCRGMAASDFAPNALPPDWKGPGSFLAERTPETAKRAK